MHLHRYAALSAAAALLACPTLALAQPPADAGAPPPAAPTLPSMPRIAPGPDIYSTLKNAGQFTILLKAVDQAGLAPVLQKYPNLTFFAPTDAAFNGLPGDVVAKLMANNDTSANQLQQILKFHLINAQVDNSKIKGAKGPVQTVEGTPVMIDGSNPDDLQVNRADILQEVRTTNGGVINVVDKVLIPTDSPYSSTLGASASSGQPSAPPAS